MIRFTGTVLYKNGRAPEPFDGGVPELAAWEEYALRHEYPVAPDDPRLPKFTWMMLIAYASLDVPEGFEVWRRTVKDIDGFEATGVDPTPTEAPSG